MKYSVIVPVYNVEQYLEKCLDSILECKGDYEVICIDDGSTDNSPAICDTYSSRYPDRVVTVHQKNKGLGGARNSGIEIARGEYLLFVDSDDFISPDTVSVLDAALEKHDADIVIFAMQTVDENMNLIDSCREELIDGELFSFKEKKDSLFIMPNACNKLFKTKLFLESGVRFPDRVWYEDIRTVPKLMCFCEKIMYVDKVLYNYLRRSGSITNNVNVKRNEEILWAFDDLKEYFTSKGVINEFHAEFEKLAIDHVFIAASVRVARINRRDPMLGRFSEYMYENFPDFEKNPYLSALPKAKKLAYSLVKGRHFFILDTLFKLKDRGK